MRSDLDLILILACIVAIVLMGVRMKPRSAIYVGGPPLDPPDDVPIIHCKLCKKKSPRTEWVRNHWHCPGCHEEDAALPPEED